MEQLQKFSHLLTAQEAAQYLRISLFTLNKIEQAGLILPYRTPGGHRRYTIEMLNEYLEQTRRQPRTRRTLSRSPGKRNTKTQTENEVVRTG